MVHPHPIPVFDKEIEPTPRRWCLFCDAALPPNVFTHSIEGNRLPGWYSNALLKRGGVIARFYLCPKHRERITEAWEWARGA